MFEWIIRDLNRERMRVKRTAEKWKVAANNKFLMKICWNMKNKMSYKERRNKRKSKTKYKKKAKAKKKKTQMKREKDVVNKPRECKQ